MSDKPYYVQQGVAMTCRSYVEYVRMFAIQQEDLAEGPILDVAAGASSFVAEACKEGFQAIAVDPLYALEPDKIEQKGLEEIEVSTAKLAGLQKHFDWTYYGDIHNHRSIRERSLRKFVADFREHGDQRYVAAYLPDLPFPGESFATVLCSHFLFLYGEQFDLKFHKQAIRELLRVCRKDGKVLIYPLKTLKFDLYPGLPEIIADLQTGGVMATFVLTELPFIPGSTELLCLLKSS